MLVAVIQTYMKVTRLEKADVEQTQTVYVCLCKANPLMSSIQQCFLAEELVLLDGVKRGKIFHSHVHQLSSSNSL